MLSVDLTESAHKIALGLDHQEWARKNQTVIGIVKIFNGLCMTFRPCQMLDLAWRHDLWWAARVKKCHTMCVIQLRPGAQNLLARAFLTIFEIRKGDRNSFPFPCVWYGHRSKKKVAAVIFINRKCFYLLHIKEDANGILHLRKHFCQWAFNVQNHCAPNEHMSIASVCT